jgi:hypothetical protein
MSKKTSEGPAQLQAPKTQWASAEPRYIDNMDTVAYKMRMWFEHTER